MLSRFKFTRNPWPAAIIAYFVLFIAFTVTLVVYISRQKMDLVRGDYYDDEIRYQEQLDRINRTEAITNQVAVAFEAARQSILITLPAGHAQTNATGRIRLYRPSDESLDRELKLDLGADGAQRVDAKGLAAGKWVVRVYWTVAGRDYFFGKPILVQPAKT